MNKINFGLIFQIIQIIAIGYLVFKILQPSSESKKLDKIEQHQLDLKKLVNSVTASNAKMLVKYDSIDRIRAKKIDSLNDNILYGIIQMRAANRKIDDWKTIFTQNNTTHNIGALFACRKRLEI